MDNDLINLKEHITDKFKAHEDLEAVRHQRINELLDHYNKEIEDNEGTIRRVHSRVDEIETKIKTVQGVSAMVTTAFCALTAWLGIRGQ